MTKKSKILDAFGNATPYVRGAKAFSGGYGYAPGGFQAAGWSRDRANIFHALEDSEQALSAYTRGQIDQKARWLASNVGMVKGVIIDFIKYVIGPGIMPFSATGDDAIDLLYDEWFFEWAKVCDIAKRQSFWDMQRARVVNKFVSGDVFTVLLRGPSDAPRLQFIRPHNCMGEQDDNTVDGIYLDKFGAPTAYKFRERGGGFRIVRGRNCIHSQITFYGDEIRQVGAMHSAILHLLDSMETLDFEKLAQKDHARIARVITKHYAGVEDEDLFEDPLESSAGNAGDEMAMPLEKIYGAEVHRLNIGEKMESFKSDRPSPAFLGFLEYLGREIYNSTGWRYEFSWDSKTANGAMARQIMDSVRRTCLIWQRNEAQTTMKLRNFAIGAAITNGDLPEHPRWWNAEYVPGAPEPTVDKGRDGKLDVMLVQNRMKTLKSFFAERGEHWVLQLRQAKREAEMLNDMGLESVADMALSNVSGADVRPDGEDEIDDRASPEE